MKPETLDFGICNDDGSSCPQIAGFTCEIKQTANTISRTLICNSDSSTQSPSSAAGERDLLVMSTAVVGLISLLEVVA